METKGVSDMLAGGATTKKYDIPLERLDYKYIEKCKDVKELENIYKVLRSGDEGVFPAMEKLCEEKIESLNPNSRVLRKDQPILRTSDLQQNERQQITEDLSSWTEEMKSKEETLKNKTAPKSDIIDNGDAASVPVRPSGSTNLGSVNKSNIQKSNKRVKPRDYREWDKVDVDAELEKVDKGEQTSINSQVLNKCREPPKVVEEEIKDLSEEERTFRAEREKDKGNESFRAGDFEEALSYYSRSLTYFPAPASYNNRALAYVKLKKWEKAVTDCNQVLKFEPKNVKALLRRGLSYKGQKEFDLAELDFKHVLKVEPNNKRAQDLLEEATSEKEKQQEEVQKSKPAPSGKGKRMVIEETDGSSSESDDEKATVQPSSAKSLTAGDKKLTNDAADTLAKKTAPSASEKKSVPVGATGNKLLNPPPSLLLNGTEKDNDANGLNITMDVNQASKNPKGKVLIEEIPEQKDTSKKKGTKSKDSVAEIKEIKHERKEFVQTPMPLAVDQLKAGGTELFKAGQYGDAMEKYRQAIKKLSSAQDQVVNMSLLLSNRAACKSKIGDCKGCIDDCTESLKLIPHSIKPLLRRADAYEHLERYDKAYVGYRHILNMDSSVDMAQKGSTRCASELRKVKGIRWRDTLPVIPSPAVDDIPVVTLLTDAKKQVANKQPAKKVKENQEMKNETKKSVSEMFEEYKSKGNDLVKQGNFKDAIDFYSKCINLCPRNVIPYTNRALCYLRTNKPDLAKLDCDKSLCLEPANVKGLFRRGQAFKMLKEYQKSFSDLRDLLKIEQKNVAAKKEMESVLRYISQENEKAKQAKTTQSKGKRVQIEEVGSSDED